MVLEATELQARVEDCQKAVDDLTREKVEATNKLAPLETRERELKVQQTLREKESNKTALKVNDAERAMGPLKDKLGECPPFFCRRVC